MMQIDHYVSERRRKQKKRRNYFLWAGVVTALYLLGLGIFYLIVRSPLFHEDHIVIQGNSAVSQADIMNLLEANVAGHSWLKAMLGFNNMLIWPDRLSTDTISVIPQLLSVSISKDYFSRTITVTVTERQPFAIWCSVGQSPSEVSALSAAPTEEIASTSSASSAFAGLDNENCFWFDEGGTLFEGTLDTEGGAIIAIHDYTGTQLTIGDSVLPREFIPALVSIVQTLQASGLAVQQVALRDLTLEEIDVTTVNGPNVYFSLRFSAADDLPVLQSIMAKPGFNKLQYIDFRVQNRAYYK